MTTAKELWARYVQYIQESSANLRVLGFAAAVICWTFKEGDFIFPPLIYWALLLIIISFAADVCHGLVGAMVLKRFIESQEVNGIGGDDRIMKPRRVDLPALVLFWIKQISLILSYLLIGIFFLSKARISQPLPVVPQSASSLGSRTETKVDAGQTLPKVPALLK